MSASHCWSNARIGCSDVDREAVLWTSEKQHTFNMPYQLSRVPELHECDTLANKFPELVDAVRRKADGESLTLKRDGVSSAVFSSYLSMKFRFLVRWLGKNASSVRAISLFCALTV